jgi:protocatechuate 3,4-dioxygenase beta subunit
MTVREEHSDDGLHDHDRGLAFDLATLIDRRSLLKLIAGASLVSLVGVACGSEAGDPTSAAPAAVPSAPPASGSETTSGSQTAAAVAECPTTIPGETAGPYPGDGSNGPNVLAETGIVRSDIRSSFGDATGAAEGVPLTIALTIVDGANGCAPLAGAAVYAWHCDRAGSYSLYSDDIAGENHLRGVQETDGSGRVTFTSIFPGCYSGRWPHVHFEVYPSLDAATGSGTMLSTSQLALPADACELVYATDGYEDSVGNLARTSLEGDNVFGDGYALQLATVTGSVDEGFVAALTVAV